MKLKHLTMQAFGPFASIESIDFDELGQDSLFLIEGETGAGKTTILDAICFALYGEATGSTREAQNMRCDHSPDNLLTKVTLVFTLGDTDYTINRIPVQQRKKAKGEGTTEQKHEVEISATREGEEIAVPELKGVKEKTDYIIEKMGFGVAQFRQIMVLPQGKFVDLLVSDAKTREKIFAKLFDTYFYQDFADRLKTRAKAVHAEYDRVSARISGILKMAGVNTELELADKTLDLSEQEKLAKEQHVLAATNKKAHEKRVTEAQQHLRDFALLANNNKELEELKGAKSQITAHQLTITTHEKAQKIRPIFEQKQKQQGLALEAKRAFNASQQQHKNEKELLITAEKHLQSAKQAALTLDQLKQACSTLESYLQDAELLTQAQQKFTIKQTENSAANTEVLKHVKEETATKRQLAEAQSKLTQLNKDLVKLAPLQQQLAKQAQERELLEKLSALAAKLTAQKTLLSERQLAQERAFAEKNALLNLSKNTEMQWHANQAAILAKELKIGEPCLVCGSTDHPCKAKFEEGLDKISKEQVDEQREVAQKAIEAWDASKVLTQNCQYKYDALQEQISELKQHLGEAAESDLSLLKKAEAQTQSTLQSLEQSLGEKPKLEQQIDELDQKLSSLATQVELAKENANSAAQELVAAATEVEQLSKRLPEALRSAHNIQDKIEAKKQSIQQIENTLTKAQGLFDQANKSVLSLASRIEEQQLQLQQEQTRQEIAENECLQGLKASQFSSEAEALAAILSQADLARLKALIIDHAKQMNSVQGRIAQLTENLKDIEQPNLAALNEKQDALDIAYQNANEQFNSIKEQLHVCQKSTQELTALQQQNQALLKEYGVVHKLSTIANGESGHKISFHRYVLSVLLDDVLSSASTRLNKMTDGRYDLLRSTDKAKGNAASGLDLMVSDAHTGKQRPVSTMSGGESFMAALALALGLSDVVQSHAGGIKLDTLFIDEGFGSLDSDSLEAAIEVLIDLQASGRTIGIISHVPELKTRMHKRIAVRSGRGGSRLSVVNSAN